MKFNYRFWIDVDYDVYIPMYDDLPDEVSEEGYVERAFGISMDALSVIRKNEDYTNVTSEVKKLAEMGEMMALAAMEIFEEDPKNEHLNEMDIDTFYPTSRIDVSFGNGIQASFDVCVNQRRIMPGVHARFICILLPEESDVYRTERAEI